MRLTGAWRQSTMRMPCARVDVRARPDEDVARASAASSSALVRRRMGSSGACAEIRRRRSTDPLMLPALAAQAPPGGASARRAPGGPRAWPRTRRRGARAGALRPCSRPRAADTSGHGAGVERVQDGGEKLQLFAHDARTFGVVLQAGDGDSGRLRWGGVDCVTEGICLSAWVPCQHAGGLQGDRRPARSPVPRVTE